MTATRAGTSVSCSTSSDDSTLSSSNANPSTASSRGDEPVAISTLRPRIMVPSETLIVRPSGSSTPVPGDDRDLAALQQRLETRREAVDDVLLAGLRRAELERGGGGDHPELGRAADGAQHLGRLEQLLGRDAAAVQAGAADPLLLDDGDVHPGARAVQRSRVAAGPAAEDHEIEVVRHVYTSRSHLP